METCFLIIILFSVDMIMLNRTLLLINQASEKYEKGGPTSTVNNEVMLFSCQLLFVKVCPASLEFAQ